MIASFSSAPEMRFAFEGLVLFFCVTIVGAVGMWWGDSLQKSRAPRLAVVGSWTCAALLLAIGWSHVATYADFVQADVSSAGIRMSFLGVGRKEVFVPRADVVTILYGGSRRDGGCYLRVVTRSGSTHRSANTEIPLAQCQSLRQQMLTALGI